MNQEQILIRSDSSFGLTTLTLNRPLAFNSLSEELIKSIQFELDELMTNESVRVLVIAGNGRAFCAGHDLREMIKKPSEKYYEKLFTQCSQMMLSIQKLPVPVIAKVQGLATAAGCQLVAQCDLAIASSEARFAVSGINLGLFCSTPSVALSRNLSRKAAFEMLATGEFISAEQARIQGLINRVSPADQLDEATNQFVDQIIKKPRTSLALGKKLFYSQLENNIEQAYSEAAKTMACNMMDSAALKGVQEFLDKSNTR